MITNNNNNNNNSNTNSGGMSYNLEGTGDIVHNLRDVCNMLNPSVPTTGGCAYDHIIDMMRGLDLQDDGIVMNHKIKSIQADFCNIVRDEIMLCESMEYINDKALIDGDTALKFAMLFSSRNFDALAMKETKVRSAMLKILETNFLNADTYRVHDKNRLYNSITLLGEYYNRVRLADNSPITILGESLLSLLIREICDLQSIDTRLAKLILSQITLNGDMMRIKHKPEIKQLLFQIRRNLIEQTDLKSSVKALLLMTLDLFYSNFTNLGSQLEEMYTKFLVQEDEDEGNNNHNFEAQISQSQNTVHVLSQQHHHHQQQQPAHQQFQPSYALQQQQQHQQQQQQQQQLQLQQNTSNRSFENGSIDNSTNDSFEIQLSTKKWSEQVCEDSYCETEFDNAYNCDTELNVSSGAGNSAEDPDRLNNSYGEQSEHLETSSIRDINERSNSSTTHSSRRSYQPRSSPRPLKQNNINVNSDNSAPNKHQSQQSGDEERDQTKPLPRWRAPRFNRDECEQNNGRQDQRRYSASIDDDHHSVRSEGGSIRLYSINDRLKHSQERFERATGNNQHNNIANSNWDHQSQRDDRSERSYISNYERGNNYKRGGRYNNRHTYDKPPRFQKHHQQQQQQQQQSHKQNSNRDQKIHSDTWRRSNTSINNSYHDENLSYQPNGPESNSRSSSRARTLPRPAKSNIDGGVGHPKSNYRHSQSPTHGGGNQYQHHNHRGTRNFNPRYSSQSSLASEASASTTERRNNHQQHQQQQQQHQRNRNFARRPQQPNAQNQDWSAETEPAAPNAEHHRTSKDPNFWHEKDESELVRNAQQTTKYMNYLSSKK